MALNPRYANSSSTTTTTIVLEDSGVGDRTVLPSMFSLWSLGIYPYSQGSNFDSIFESGREPTINVDIDTIKNKNTDDNPTTDKDRGIDSAILIRIEHCHRQQYLTYDGFLTQRVW